ncbi:MAG: L-serine ammonia-lyase, iron-sulfur-dependent subunit beta [bacterium]|nr:L-serine ammonia-lyase, iron-sulfur-dependent subunit beta [bacterium]
MSESWSVFDVIGPVMVGPSSSHTAGAAKIGYFARIINGQQPKEVKLLLHGSFGQVYEGHCTDKAIIGGLLGLLPHSDQIRNAAELAEQVGMKVIISPSNLGDTVHPNSVRIEMTNADGSFHRVRGKSIGGGKIVIREIDKVDCQIDMSYSCLIVMLSNRTTDALSILDKVKQMNMNIVKFDISHYKELSMLTVETFEHFDSKIIEDLETTEGVIFLRFLNHISNYQHFA